MITPGAADDERAARPLRRLREVLEEVSDLHAAEAVLGWDQETYMPSGGVDGRAHQLATLGRLAHERLASAEVGELLEESAKGVLDGDSFEARFLRVIRRDHARATRIPSDLVAALARAAALGQQAWKRARSADDFATFRPHLEEILTLVRAKADALGYDQSAYDALVDEYEPDMRTARLVSLFSDLSEQLVPLVQAILDEEAPDASCLHGDFDPALQWSFGLGVIRELGFDFDRGRQDRSAHPFSTSFGTGDVRITTRINDRFLSPGLFGTMHEAGHALYEQGFDQKLDRTPLAAGTSLGMHESQSRLWENLVGRSHAFWQCYLERLGGIFPARVGGVDLESFYRAINRVERTPIRVEADEVTYNLHVVVRFELEVALIEGDLRVADLPAAWNDRMEQVLGVRPRTAAEGVLQDIHWSMGAFGYFPTYCLGNLMSAQLFRAAEHEIDDLQGQIAAGRFEGLLSWLRDRVHRHGRVLTAPEILSGVTGKDLSADDWLTYVRDKYTALYPGMGRGRTR